MHLIEKVIMRTRAIIVNVRVYLYIMRTRAIIINVRVYRKGQSKMDNSYKLAARVHKTKKGKAETQHDMSWTPLYANKHK